MKRLMLVAASLVLVGGFMVGCGKKSETEQASDKVGAAVEDAEKAAEKETDKAKDLLDDL